MATTRLPESKQLNGAQLVAELRAAGLDVTSDFPSLEGDSLSVEGSVSDAQLASSLAAHVADPNFGKTAEQKDAEAATVEIGKIRDKAKAVAAGMDTFTPAQVQKILAHLVLRATR